MNAPSRRSVLRALAASALAGKSRGFAETAGQAEPSHGPAQDSDTVPIYLGESERADAVQRLTRYFHENAPRLLREAQGYLRYKSISPSLPHSQYSTELWDWDTLWTTQGLLHVASAAHDVSLRAQIIEHAKGSLLNFLDHQAADGRVPMLITVSNPDPLHCLEGSAPHKENQAKPVLAQLALLISREIGYDWLRPHFHRLLQFFESWTANNLSHTGLLVWGDDVAIGNDNDPTTFGRPFFSSANLLLNSLWYQDLLAAADLAEHLGLSPEAADLQERARKAGTAIQKCCWDPRDQFFYTADVQCVDRRAELIPNVPRGMGMSWDSLPLRIQTFTGFLPLWCGIATREQAHTLVEVHYKNPKTFGAKSGVRSLSAQETMYSLARSTNPSNWLGPVWIIVNYLVWSGLKRYGMDEEANRLAHKTIRILSGDLARTGSLNEYYHPDTGEPLSHRGFMDWNLLVLAMA
jgi:putative isomerase